VTGSRQYRRDSPSLEPFNARQRSVDQSQSGIDGPAALNEDCGTPGFVDQATAPAGIP